MANKNTADLIVVPLLLFRPVLALGLVQLCNYLKASLVAVVTESVLEEGLVKVETFDSVQSRVGVFAEELGNYMPRLILLLDKTEYLIDFVGNNVPVFIDLIFQCISPVSLQLR